MNPTELKIVWREWDHPPSRGLFGHGVQFLDCEIESEDNSLVAFLDGFEWRHGFSNEVIIYCIRPNTRTPQDVLSNMKKRVEAILAEREIPTGQITSRFYALVNG
jgi:hypothetical protein